MKLYCVLLTCLFVSIFSAAQVNLDSGLVAYYPFDGNLTDESVNTNNGNAVGTIAFEADRFGNPSSCLRFQGVSNPGRVDVSNNSTLQFSTSATFSFWMSVSSAFGTFGNGSTGNGGNQCPFTKNGDQGGGLWHLTNFSGNTLSNIFGNVSTPASNANIAPYTLGDWVHVTYTMAPTETRMYINGALITTWIGAPNFSTMNNRNLSFGRFVTNWYPFNGSLDDFRIYNRELTQLEITSLLNTDVPELSIVFNQSAICAGASIDVAYTATGNIFTGNQFIVQLSDENGNFTNPVNIGTLSSTNLTGTISATIPEITGSGNSYKIRAISTNIGSVSNESANLSITGILQTIPNPLLYNYLGSLNGNHYYVSTNQLPWNESVAQAQENGGHLAVIPNAQTNTFIQNALGGLSAYIGLTDNVSEGTFVWADGSPITYTNWNPGEPNNAGGGNGEDFVVMFNSGRWNDGSGGPLYAVMQLRPAGIPQTICSNSTLQLNAAPLVNASYSWSGPAGFTSNIQNPQIQNVGVLNSGNYSLTYTANGCSVSVSTAVTVNQIPSNINQNSTLISSLSQGLILHYPMNGNANDVIGNGINGTSVGGVTPTADRFGNANSAMQLNGTNGHIQVPAGVYFDGSPFTVSAWVNRSNNANWSRLFDFGLGQANNNVLLGLSNGPSGTPAAEIYNNNSTAGQITSSTTSPLNQWNLFTYTWANNQGTIYLNGVIVSSGTQQAPNNVTRTLNYIGRSNWSNDAFANAAFDDFRIYNRALTQTEIRNLTMEQTNNIAISAAPLVLCGTGTSTVTLSNTQFGVSYRLRNSQTQAFIGNAQIGNGNTLTFTTGSLTVATTLEIVATSVGTTCPNVLNSPIQIVFGPAVSPTITATGPLEFCNGESVELNIPEQSGATYQWKRNAVNIGNNAASFTATTAGIYTVEVINPCGTVQSANSATVTISGTAPIIPVVSSLNNPIICEGESITLTTQNQSNVNYVWYLNGNPTGNNSFTFNTSQAGDYTVEVSNNCGEFLSNNSLAVVVGTFPLVSVNTVQDVICAGTSTGSITIDAVGGSNYLWNTGETTEDIFSLTSGSYTLTVTSDEGCETTLNAVVNEPEILVISAEITPQSAGFPNGAIDLSVTGGTAPYTYNWNNGASVEDLVSVSAGEYIVTVRDSNNCNTTETFEIGIVTALLDFQNDSILVYPNPSNQIINIQVPANLSGANWYIFDGNGRIINKGKIISTSFNINTLQLSDGIYSLEIGNGKIKSNHKIIVQH